MVLLFMVEVMDFAYYLHSGVHLSAGLSAGAAESVQANGVGEEEFEMVNANHSGNSSAEDVQQGLPLSASKSKSTGALKQTADIHDTHLAASLSLSEFNTPSKSSAHTQQPRLSSATPTPSTMQLVTHYLNNRRYGRGALAGVLMALYSGMQACTEIYWKVYFCSFGRRPRAPEYTTDAGYSQVTGTFNSAKARKIATHTV